MNLYDECLYGVDELLKKYPPKRLNYDENTPLKDVGKNQLIFASDTAFELGGGNKPAVSSIALTSDKAFVPEDEILLIGSDLKNIKDDCSFARIALIRTDELDVSDANKLYAIVRKIEYTRYHINPEGYMMRISALSHREGARISKQGLKKGLDFSSVGSLFINAYKSHPQVKAVKLIFVTLPDFPYHKLENIMKKSEDITKALDHIMRDVKMDCDTCGLKAVCEEVEKLSPTD